MMEERENVRAEDPPNLDPGLEEIHKLILLSKDPEEMVQKLISAARRLQAHGQCGEAPHDPEGTVFDK